MNRDTADHVPVNTFGSTLTLTWETGRVTLQSLGAMIANLVLRLPDGREHQPLARAPWVDDPDHGQSGLMAGLSGEWPCVPFGSTGEVVPLEWQAPEAWEDPLPHGSAAHLHWMLARQAGCLKAGIDLSEWHPIMQLERKIRPIPQGIEIELHILPRRDCDLPIGLHPGSGVAGTFRCGRVGGWGA